MLAAVDSSWFVEPCAVVPWPWSLGSDRIALKNLPTSSASVVRMAISPSVGRAISFREHQGAIVGGWLWFFLVLFAYYCLKPLRDGLGTQFAGKMNQLYVGTLLATVAAYLLYSALATWVSRRWLVLGVHQVFVVQMIGFHAAFRREAPYPDWLVAVFFVWVSVFNLSVVTLFWSVMADVFAAEDGKRWFGSMAAAGSVGSLCGSVAAWGLTRCADMRWLLVASMLALEGAVVVAWWLETLLASSDVGWRAAKKAVPGQATGGSIWSGFSAVLTSPYLLGICVFVSLGKFAATFVYNFLQVTLLNDMPDAQLRTQLFSTMNFWSQGGSLIAQGLLAAWCLRTLGVGGTLAIPGIALVALFLVIQYSPTLQVMVVAQVLQQVLGYGLLVPAQHVLFTVVSRDEKYKAKALIDNVVFRGSDVASAEVCTRMIASQVSLGRAAGWFLPLLVAWTGVGLWLGRSQRRRSAAAAGP